MRVAYFFIPVIILSCNSSTENTSENEGLADTTTAVTENAGFEASRIQAAEIPETIIYEGKVQDVYRWQDKSGDNIFFVSVKGPYPDLDKGEAEEEGKTAEIFAVHYLKDSGADYRAIWRMKDREFSCPLDITTELLPGSLTVTDLDQNGIGEVKFQYALACRGDVSPASMKLLMEESGKQYSLNGSRWVEFSPDFKFDISVSNVNIEKLPVLDDGEDDLLRSYGRYRSEKEFASAPPAFIEYARNEWIKYAIETFNN